MKHALNTLAAGLLLSAALFSGCKKAEAPPVPTPVPTPTAVQMDDLVAFTRDGAVWVCRSDGEGARILARPSKDEAFWFPAASADHDAFFAWVSHADGTQDVVKIDLTGKVSVLTQLGEKASPQMKNLNLENAPSASPDKRHVAFSFNGILWVMDVDGLNAQTLISDGASWAPAYSPNGQQLAYVNGSDDRYDLWITEVNTRDTYQVTDFAGFSVGHPRWSPSGDHLLLTRSRGEESDVIEVASKADTPAADADTLSKDHQSVGAAFGPDGTHVVFSSARADSLTWDLYVTDATGNSAKQITHGGGLSPEWMLPTTQAAHTLATPIPLRPSPTAVPSPRPTAIATAVPSAVPTQVPTQVPTPAPAKSPVKTPAKAPDAAPTEPKAASASTRTSQTPAVTVASTPPASTKAVSGAGVSATAAAPGIVSPTASVSVSPAPAARPPFLMLTLAAGFDSTGAADAQTLDDLKQLARKVKPYAGDPIVVVGPPDSSDGNGSFETPEARSTARAQSVALALAADAGLAPTAVRSEPYSPPTVGGRGKGVRIYLDLR